MTLRISDFCRRLVWFTMVLLTGFPEGRGAEVYPLSAWIKVAANPNALKVDIHQTSPDGTVTVSLAGQTQQRVLNMEMIERISLLVPPAVEEAMGWIERREYVRAEGVMRPYAEAVLPFLVLEESNAARIVDRYLYSLHQRNERGLLREVYLKSAQLKSAEVSKRARGWLAYVDAREGKTEAAAEWFADGGIEPGSGELYFLQQLAFCRHQMAGGAHREAIDHSARVIAAGRIEDALYPEALYLSAQCYEGLAREEQERLEAERRAALEKELLIERVRVALALEAEADRTGAPPPTEEDILGAVDRGAVEARVPPVPPFTENPFARIAQRLYLFTEQVFPSTYWGGQSGTRIWPETREAHRNDLSTFTFTDDPT